MNAFLLWMRRRPLFSLLLMLLLLLAAALTTLGVSMRTGASGRAAEVSENYVTIAVPVEERTLADVRKELREKYGEDYPEEKINAEADAYDAATNPIRAHAAAMESGFAEAEDTRFFLGAEVKGCKALTSAANDPLKYKAVFDWMSCDMAVFAVQCRSVRDSAVSEYDELGNRYVTYEASMTILDTVSLADGYPAVDDPTGVVLGSGPIEEGKPVPELQRLTVLSEFYAPDGTIPFEPGHTYLVCGHYSDFLVTNVMTYEPVTDRIIEKMGRSADGGRMLSLKYYDFYYSSWGNVFTFTEESFDKGYHRSRGKRSDGTTYFYPAEGELPMYAEYEGSWQDFLAGKDGRVWREEIIPLCEINQSSAPVLLSNNVKSMYCFNSGVAGLVDGRFFTAGEYERGDAVCMVSAAYALYNGCELGDELELDLYDTGFNWQTVTLQGQDLGAMTRGACMPDRRLGVTKKYRIVGVYSVPEINAGSHVFRADTILIPKASVPGSEQYQQFNEQILYSIILKNGTQEEFQAYMEEAGFGPAFTYFDQGYSAAEISLGAMAENGLKLLLIGLGALAAAAAAAHFLAARGFRPTARSMRLLGEPETTVRRQTFGAFALMDAVSAVLGAGLAAVLFSGIAERAYSEALPPDPLVIALCALAVFALLLLPSLLCSSLLAAAPLMNSGAKERKRK